MAEMMSTYLANYIAGTGSLKAAFSTTMELRIYTGTVPATADAAVTPATVLCVVKTAVGANNPYLQFAAAVAGLLSQTSTETWIGTNTGSTANASFYRLVVHADADSADTTTYPRIQGTIGTSNADMLVGSVSIAGSGGTLPVNVFNQQVQPN